MLVCLSAPLDYYFSNRCDYSGRVMFLYDKLIILLLLLIVLLLLLITFLFTMSDLLGGPSSSSLNLNFNLALILSLPLPFSGPKSGASGKDNIYSNKQHSSLGDATILFLFLLLRIFWLLWLSDCGLKCNFVNYGVVEDLTGVLKDNYLFITLGWSSCS